MSAYTIYFTTDASAVVTVEADDLDSAIEAAYDELCAGSAIDLSDVDLGDWEPKADHEVDGRFVDGGK